MLGATLILLAACSLAAVATAAFRVPALLGYLAVGALLGPSVIFDEIRSQLQKLWNLCFTHKERHL
nr:hypothetical protein [Pseudomonas sp. s4]